MSVRELHRLVGMGVISDEFRASVLDSRRAERIRDFDLETDEAAEIMAIEANTFAEFAAAVEKMISARWAQRVPVRPVNRGTRSTP